MMECGGWGTTLRKHWISPPHEQTPSSQTPFSTARVCSEGCLGQAPQTVECGSKGLGGCVVLHGEGHIFLAPCDCRVVSPAVCLACGLFTREVSEWERRTLYITPNPGLIFSLDPSDVRTHRGAGHQRHTKNSFCRAPNAHRMLAIFFSMVFLMNATGATRPSDR